MLVLAEDLIWSTRLVSIVTRAGGRGRTVATLDALEAALADGTAALVIVDLGGRNDGIAAIGAAHRVGARVIAIGPHEDQALRRRALAAGALRVYANSKMHAGGPALVRSWLTPPSAAE